MKLIEYLNLYDGLVSFDTQDNEIEGEITISWDKNSRKPENATEEYLYKCEEELYGKVDIVKLFGKGEPLCAYTDFIKRNMGDFKKFVKEHWQDHLQDVASDESNLCYEFIKDLDNLVGGRYGLSAEKDYYDLLKNCK